MHISSSSDKSVFSVLSHAMKCTLQMILSLQAADPSSHEKSLVEKSRETPKKPSLEPYPTSVTGLTFPSPPSELLKGVCRALVKPAVRREIIPASAALSLLTS